MQKIPGINKRFKSFFFLYPYVFKRLNLKNYEIILCSSSSFANFAKKPEGSVQISYCYTPPRFLWDSEKYIKGEKLNQIKSSLIGPVLKYFRKIDIENSKKVDYFIAISRIVKERIKKVYNRESVVIYPPIEFEKYIFNSSKENFYLLVSRLKNYKRLDVAINAFNDLGKKLFVVGTGEDLEYLKGISAKNITFLGRLTEKDLLDLYSRAKALIFTGEEDFGMIPLEAQASGTPVIAYGSGGALETIIEGVTGYFFYRQTLESLKEKILEFENNPVDSQKCRENAARFDFISFRDKISEFVKRAYDEKFN
jgi:glycosyltransferase involved in cell wall biosynthesis